MSLISSASINRGSASVANGGVVSHNCPTEPFLVLVVYKGDDNVNVWWNWDGSQITVYHDSIGNINVRWIAFYV